MINRLWHWLGWFTAFLIDRSSDPWFSKKWKILHVRTCQIWQNIEKWQKFQKPWISHPRVVKSILIRSWCSLDWLVLDISHALLYFKNYMSRPVKFVEKFRIVKLVRNHSYYFRKWSHDDQQAMTLVGLF